LFSSQIFALIAVAAARPNIGIQSGAGGYSSGGNEFLLTEVGVGGGSLFQGISSYDAPLVSGSSLGGFQGNTGGGSAGGSFGRGAGVEQGQTQVIDISGGGSSGGVIYKPVVKIGPAQESKSFFIYEAPG
jgi:hypothetical protein